MITISAFADEIGPDLKLQMDVCETHGIKCIDVRGIDGVNCSKMTLEKVKQYKKQMDDRGFTMPCLGTPIGKIRMDENFDAHLDLLKHCFEVADAFGSKLLRIFSFYPSQGKRIEDERAGVMTRMEKMVAAAEKAGMVLMHENEKAIYGAKPAGVLDLFKTIQSPAFKSIFDPANYVEEDVRPYDDGWTKGLGDLTVYFHIKDKNPGEHTCVPAGTGKGQFMEIFQDLKARNYNGVMTLEPHMKAAEQFQGFSGADLFAKAVDALKAVCDKVGLQYKK